MAKNQKPKGPPLLSEQSLEKQVGYFSAIVESLEGQIKGVAESLELTREELKQDMAIGFAKHDQDIELIHLALRQHTQEIKGLDCKIDTVEQKLTARIDSVEQNLTEKIDGVEQKLTTKIDHVEQTLTGKMDGLEKNLSGKMDRVIDAVERHDKEIILLKSAVS